MDIELQDASGVPFYRQIKDQIARMIRTGQLSPGTKLPSVRELSAQLLVSLITVRRSYADLEAEELIVRRRGHGTYVSEEAKTLSQEQMKEEGRALLMKALAELRTLGLGEEEWRALVVECVAKSEGAEND